LYKSADVAVGYMFSGDELARATDEVDAAVQPAQTSFLSAAVDADPASWTADPVVEEEPPSDTERVAAAPLETVPETIISAREAFERVLDRAMHLPARVADADTSESVDAAAEVTRDALYAALAATIRESPPALEDLASAITQKAQPSYAAARPVDALAPSVKLYRMLDRESVKAVDVAASMLGLRDLEPVVADLEEEAEEGAPVDVALEEAFEPVGALAPVEPTESGTPSSEDFEDLVAVGN
jgi:hypothetical protein